MRDLVQPNHSIQRNYPIIGHIRWMVELVRPEIRQVLIEGDEEAAPFARAQRSLVYNRAKGEMGEHPFGTFLDVDHDGYEFISHSSRPKKPADLEGFRITIFTMSLAPRSKRRGHIGRQKESAKPIMMGQGPEDIASADKP